MPAQGLVGRHQTGPPWIEVDLVDRRDESTRWPRVNELGPVATRQEVAGQLVSAVEPLGIGVEEPFHARHPIGSSSARPHPITVSW